MDSRKRARVQSSDDDDDELEVDRISGLCDELLHHVFSFLPTREVVQTCVLSKRWRNLWCSVPWLDFDEDAFVLASSSSSSGTSSSSFSTFVNYAMLLRDGSNIQKLRLSCSSSSDNTTTSNRSVVFQYIVTAIRHKLRVLDLKILHHHNQAADIDVLPPSLFTCESLTCLKLNNVVLPSPSSSSICLSSLKTLHLISVQFPSDQLSTESLFSNSTNLETLTIHNCNFEHLQGFDIYAWQLKNLIIIQDQAPPPPPSSTSSTFTGIHAPNLTSLKLHVDIQSRCYVLIDLNSLVEANIHIKKPLSKYISLCFMIGILCELQNAKAIALSGSCLEHIGKGFSSPVDTIKSQLTDTMWLRFMKSKENPFPNLKLMKLKTWFEDEEIGAITDLLKRSPNIETLVIEYNSVLEKKSVNSAKEYEVAALNDGLEARSEEEAF